MIEERSDYMDRYYDIEIDDIAKQFEVDLEKGQSSEKIPDLIKKFGANELKKTKKNLFKVIIAPIINLLIIIYIIGAVALLLLGEFKTAVPNLIILGFNAVIAIIQQFRAEKQLKALKQLSAAKCLVIRDGKEIEIDSRNLVPGDIIKFTVGDKIPADCRIIDGVNISIDESSLTGESEPVRKFTLPEPIIANEKLPLQDQKNMLFLGTFVSSGRGKAIVVRTGQKTELGKINVALEESNTGDIPLRRKMNTLALQLGVGVIVLLTISIIYRVIYLISDGVLDWIHFKEALTISIDLGLKVLPINLPLLTTIVLLTGTLAMAKKGVIVRELSSTESLGRVSVLCSDKTGTLTKNEMTSVIIWTPSKEFGVSGYGYEPKGEIYELNSKTPAKKEDIEPIILSGFLNNNASLIQNRIKVSVKNDKGDKIRERWDISGLPTEGALLVLAKKFDNSIEEKVKEYKFVQEFGFDSSIKRMSKVFEKDNKFYIFSKGATEWILPLCSQYLIDGKVVSLDDGTKNTILSNMKTFADAGYRVLAVCNRVLNKEEAPADWEQDKLREKIEQNLVFLGLIVILDPPREHVETAVSECQSAGIMVVMITGDNLSTGKAIAKQINIFHDESLAAEGKDLKQLSDEEFLRTTVYGRVNPEHKQIIVERFQKMNRIVSMSGDGINDALALSMADCGLAMGLKGTEVAKEAADMIITDDSFSTIVTGIKEGRGLYRKIQAIIYFFVLVSVMEALIFFIDSFFHPPDWRMFDTWQLNLLYITAHAFPSLGFVLMWTSKHIMNEKPRDSAQIIPKEIFKALFIQMFFMGITIAGAYYLCLYGLISVNSYNLTPLTNYNLISNFDVPVVTPSDFQASVFKARTLSFAVLFTQEGLVMPFQIRRINEPLKRSWRDAWEFGWYLAVPIAFIVVSYIVPFEASLSNLFGGTLFFVYLDAMDWLYVGLLCIPNLIGYELIRKKFKIIEHRDSKK